MRIAMAVAALTGVACSGGEATPERPNIVILVLDTVRCSATSLCPGGAQNTPTLEKLAEGGVNFENAYSTTDETPPSHFSIFTGFKEGIHSDFDVETNGVAYHLKRIGYDSVGVSANNNVRKEIIRSVRPFREFLSPAERHLRRLPLHRQLQAGLTANQMIRRYDAPFTPMNRNLSTASAKTVNALLDVVLASARKPALVFANFIDAHDPYFPPPAFYDLSKEPPIRHFKSDLRTRRLPGWMRHPERIRDEEERRDFEIRLKNVKGRPWSLSDDLSDKALERYQRRYEAEVAYLDSQIADTIAIFRRRGFYDNTLFFITADHGECFGEKGYITHYMSNQGDEETTRHVPMVILPTYRKVEGPRRVEARVSIADLTPTVYDILGIDDRALREAQGANYGRSLLPHLGLNKGERRPGDSRYAIAPQKLPSAAQDNAEEELLKSLKALGYIE